MNYTGWILMRSTCININFAILGIALWTFVERFSDIGFISEIDIVNNQYQE